MDADRHEIADKVDLSHISQQGTPPSDEALAIHLVLLGVVLTALSVNSSLLLLNPYLLPTFRHLLTTCVVLLVLIR